MMMLVYSLTCTVKRVRGNGRMWKMFGSKKTRIRKSKHNLIVYITAISVGLFLLAAASADLIAGNREYSEAREEYDRLNEFYPAMHSFLDALLQNRQDQGAEDEEYVWIPGLSRMEDSDTAEDGATNPLEELRQINPDFAGWISIGDFISYPVVRGKDNDYYLDRTFTRQKNPSGAIFMDYRNEQGFNSPVCILYGHNMKDRTMFAQLHKYRESAFMEEHPDISIITSEGEVLVYRVFAAKLVVDENRAYRLNFPDVEAAAKVFPKSPEGASRFLLLSTCTNSSYNFERLLVYAALFE